MEQVVGSSGVGARLRRPPTPKRERGARSPCVPCSRIELARGAWPWTVGAALLRPPARPLSRWASVPLCE
eukprot:5207355-Pyramimonas_sp.AAC.1